VLNIAGRSGDDDTMTLPIGITENGVLHTDSEPLFELETIFRMVRESGVFDYIDKTPPAGLVPEYLRLSEKYGLPVRSGGWYYTLGRDDALLKENLEIGAALGSVVHNTQIMLNHADGHVLSDQEVADAFLWATDIGERVGCLPCFEVHVNMWSEDFARVEKVADLVEARGQPFRLTLDHSHVIFKIDNPEEQKIFGTDAAIAAGDLVLDPRLPGSVCDRWIERGLVWHAHARAAVPNNPRNIMAQHPDGTVGRGIQYPFKRPGPGEYHAPWDEAALEPWKLVVQRLVAHHECVPNDPLGQIAVEFIPYPDYGSGGKYSIFENAVACGVWLKSIQSAA
jgi:hypothetical protein